MGKHKLTLKENLFIHNYLTNNFNGTQAAISAGYSKKSAYELASRLLRKVEVIEGIKKALDDTIGKYKNTLHYEILHTYRVRAFYDPSDIIDENGGLIVSDLKELGDLTKCIEGIETKPGTNGEKIHRDDERKIKLCDREKALDQLSKYMGMMNLQVEHTGKDGQPIEVCLTKKDLIKIRKDMIKEDDV